MQGLTLLSFDPNRVKAHPKVLAFYQKMKNKTLDLANSNTLTNLVQRNTEDNKEEE
jgi:hypothetical protein